MSDLLRQRLYDELDSLSIVDPHTHIDPLAPAAATLADLLGYHYYTELAHSAGMPREEIEAPGLAPRDMVRQLVPWLPAIENTVQYGWLVEIAREFLGFDEDRITPDNWEVLDQTDAERMRRPEWSDHVLERSKLSAVFLTNAFDDPLTGFDTRRFVPCLRTDDLVFHLAKPDVRSRLEQATGMSLGDAAALRTAIGALFDRFTRKGARACAISLPSDFAPRRVEPVTAATVWRQVLDQGPQAGAATIRELAHYVFWTLAEFCTDFRLPLDLMIGVERAVYTGGVFQGQDLFDSRVSLIAYRELFNTFPRVRFPVSVLASVTNQELVAFSWIFPNVYTHGHWWYSNTPAYIEHDLAARLEAVPQTKQIGYYSDMYKLEFALPKFRMYKRVLAKVLAERFVVDRNWSEDRALSLGRRVLRDNVEAVFRSADQ